MSVFTASLDVEGNPRAEAYGKVARVTITGYQGSIYVDYKLKKKNSTTEFVVITVGRGGEYFELYNGPINGLLSKRGQGAIVRKFAHDALERENRRAK